MVVLGRSLYCAKWEENVMEIEIRIWGTLATGSESRMMRGRLVTWGDDSLVISAASAFLNGSECVYKKFYRIRRSI